MTREINARSRGVSDRGACIRCSLLALCVRVTYRGPVIHYFHTFLDKVVFRGMEQSSPLVVVGKLAIDQLLFAPVFTALYFVLRGLTEDRGLATTSKKLRRELWGIMCSSWAVWVPANFVSYLAIPLELRVLFGNVVGLFWNAFLIAKVSRN